jgi:hypothetical protein
MTRAPISASRPVHSGAASACSMETTRSPSSGFVFICFAADADM